MLIKRNIESALLSHPLWPSSFGRSDVPAESVCFILALPPGSWAVYQTAAKQKFSGNVYDQPNEESAIKAAIEEFKVPPDERGTLLALRRD